MSWVSLFLFFFIVFNLQPFGVTESIVSICVKIGKQKSRK